MQQPFEDIKKAYPDEWLILGNPVIHQNSLDIIAADLLYHGPDKRELAHREKPLLKAYKRKAIIYNGPIMKTKRSLVSVRRIFPQEPLTVHNPIKHRYEV